MDLKALVAIFEQRYGSPPMLYRAPGRVNLIGEHTDYNMGFVLPAAIDRQIVFAIAPNGKDFCRAYALDLQEEGSFPLLQPKRSAQNWLNYLIGVTALLQEKTPKVKGFDLVFGGNIPLGAGLSSSAALECGLAFALNDLYDLGLDKVALVKLAQMAEHKYAGVNCGIMDQFASMCGQANSALLLDCRSLETELVPMQTTGYQFLLCNTGVSHSLASSAYNTRRQECETGVGIIRRKYPKVNSLRDVSVAMFEECKPAMAEVVARRCSYVIAENTRVLDACNALKASDLPAFGALMYASHEGLSNDYEVSCKELDFLVEFTRDTEAVLGSRMMGGGFGGCTISLIEEKAVSGFVAAVSQAYQAHTGIALKTYPVKVMPGTSKITV